MIDLGALLERWWTSGTLIAVARAALILALGLVAARLLGAAVERLLHSKVEIEAARLARRAVFYGVCALFLAAALNEVGFDLTILLGAAGILSVAIGFASQTSASNIISGLFLIGERPFGVGDTIRVGSTIGEVLSIDLLSVKLRTFDNLYVRIPNETLIKSEVTSLTRFPIRRADLKFGVGYGEDLGRVRKVLLEVCDRNPLSLEQPAPILWVTAFGSSSVDLHLAVWATQESYLELKTGLQEEIHGAFREAGIEIPFPQLSVHAGRGSSSIPLSIDRDDAT